MSKLVLDVQNVVKTFNMGGSKLQVLKGINMEVEAGESIAIVGPSGAGKTTLLNIAGGLMTPTTGEVMVNGEQLNGQSDEALSQLRNRLVGFVFQMHHLLPEFSAIENVALPSVIRGHSMEEGRQKAAELLRQVGLKHRMEHRPGELSGGEQQRVAIARSLINDPALLMADEPTGDLDGSTADEIHQLLLALNKERKQTLILVTHNPELAKLTDRIIRMKDGHIES